MTDESKVEDATIIGTDGQPEVDLPKIKAGFVVLFDQDGTMYIERNKAAIAGVEVERDATLIEVRRYAQEIIFDLAAQAAAEYTSLRLAPQASQVPVEAPAPTEA